MTVNPLTDVVGHQETDECRYGQRQELGVGRTPVHVGREVLGEEEDDDGGYDRRPDVGITAVDETVIVIDELAEDKTTAEEETTHHVAVAPLYEIHHLQTLVGLPGTKQQHDHADEVGDGILRQFGTLVEGDIEQLI